MRINANWIIAWFSVWPIFSSVEVEVNNVKKNRFYQICFNRNLELIFLKYFDISFSKTIGSDGSRIG